MDPEKRKTPFSKTVVFTPFGLFFKPNHSKQLFSTFHKFYKSEISVLKTTLSEKRHAKPRFVEVFILVFFNIKMTGKFSRSFGKKLKRIWVLSEELWPIY